MTAAPRTIAVAFCLALTAVLSTIVLTQPAGAFISTTSATSRGAGVTHPGREVTLSIAITNTSTARGVTPELIERLGFSAAGVKFNGGARGVAVCTARIRRDGERTSCPSKARVGSGSVRAILGVPGGPSDKFGPLSNMAGSFTLYNYRHPRNRHARMLAVINSKRPIGGIAMNVTLDVDRSGFVSVNLPTLSQLPRDLAKAYPKGTKVVLTALSARIASPRASSGHPFAWRTRSNERGFRVVAMSPSRSGTTAQPARTASLASGLLTASALLDPARLVRAVTAVPAF